jgi:hypothetical protein
MDPRPPPKDCLLVQPRTSGRVPRKSDLGDRAAPRCHGGDRIAALEPRPDELRSGYAARRRGRPLCSSLPPSSVRDARVRSSATVAPLSTERIANERAFTRSTAIRRPSRRSISFRRSLFASSSLRSVSASSCVRLLPCSLQLALLCALLRGTADQSSRTTDAKAFARTDRAVAGDRDPSCVLLFRDPGSKASVRSLGLERVGSGSSSPRSSAGRELEIARSGLLPRLSGRARAARRGRKGFAHDCGRAMKDHGNGAKRRPDALRRFAVE